MSDLFHPDVPIDYIQRAFEVMRRAPWHRYQILTKRSERLAALEGMLDWHQSIWMGVSVESDRYVHRIDDLRMTKAHIKFLSLEPLLGPLGKLDLTHIDWVIVGGESGPHARRMNSDWVRAIRDQCVAKNVPFFFKQWGGVFKKKTGRTLDDQTWNEMPPTMPESTSPAEFTIIS